MWSSSQKAVPKALETRSNTGNALHDKHPHPFLQLHFLSNVIQAKKKAEVGVFGYPERCTLLHICSCEPVTRLLGAQTGL